MRALLLLTMQTGSRTFALGPGQELVVGRSASCDVVVPDEAVSRRHCRIRLVENGVHVQDLGSSQGLKKNGVACEECVLGAGETVWLATSCLRVEELGSATNDDNPQSAEPRKGDVPTAQSFLGRTIGNYRILSLLGVGGHAFVYRAEQIHLGREVALKVLRDTQSGASAQSTEAFLSEARAAAALSHPRLVQVFDFGADQGLHFLSMELLRGGSLVQRLRTAGKFAWTELEPIVHEVLEALAVAHAAGLVHRDVKPGNVLLTEDGHAKLADLGLARGIGREGDRCGTPAYMAPEQVRAETVDARADLYALGATIYHLLTGELPFGGRSRDMLRQKLAQPAPALRHELGVPAPIARLVAALLECDPDDRPRDVEAVWKLLESPSGHGPRRSRSSSRRPRRASTSSGLQLGWVFALVAAVVAAAILFRFA